MKKRLFLAISLPKCCMDAFSEFRDQHEVLSGIHWMNPKNLHMTVAYFGDIDVDVIPDMITRLKKIINTEKPFQLQYDGLHYAPPQKRMSTMLWCVFEQSKEYKKLSKKIFREFHLKSERKHIPHVTIARFDKPVKKRLSSSSSL